MNASNLEDVGEIGIEGNAQGHFERGEPMVHKQQLFVALALPQESGAQNVKNAARDCDCFLTGDVKVSQVGGKKKVVGRDGGAQQQWPGVPQIEGELRKVPCTLEEQALFAQSRRLHVPEAVKYEKHSTVLENSSTVVRGR